MKGDIIHLDEAQLELIIRSHALKYRSRLGHEQYELFEEQVIDIAVGAYMTYGWQEKGLRPVNLLMFTEYVDRWYEMQYEL